MKAANVITMASGMLPDNSGMKFFFYAKEDLNSGLDLLGTNQSASAASNSIFYLTQMIISSSGDVSAIIKTSGSSESALYLLPDILLSALAPLGSQKF